VSSPELTVALLSHEQIQQIHAAAIAAGLTESREVLLTGIDLVVRESLGASQARSGQILRDLDALNQMRQLSDGSVPLQVWLTNARNLAGPRVQGEVFGSALESLEMALDRTTPHGVRDEPVSTMPPGAGQTRNNLPSRRLFVGREAEFAALDRALASVQRRASIYGLAGVGKTALALQYAHRAMERGAYPGGVYWLGAEGEPRQALVRLAGELHIAGPSSMRSAIQEALSRDKSTIGLTQALRLILQNHPEPSLLVLDNIDMEGWSDLVPAGEVRLLTTARDEQWAIGAPLRLATFATKEARELSTLIAGEPRDEAERANRQWVIETELGGLAVAVEMASRAVKRFRLSWAGYRRDWREKATALSKNKALYGDYERGVFEAIDLSLGLCGPGGARRRLLEGAAVFAPEEVPYAWAAEAAGLDSTRWDTKEALATLEGLGLLTVERDGKSLSIHRLVHGRVRERANQDAWAESCLRAAACVSEWLEQTVDPTRMAEIDALRLHVDEALAAAKRAGSASDLIDIANRLATHLQYRALYREAHELFEQALEKAQAAEPPDPARIATSLSNLSLVLQDLGRVEEARPLLDRSLAIVERLYGADHPKVATRLSNLAAVLLATGEAEEALPLSKRAAEMLEKTYGAEHPRVAAPLSSLAAALQSVGEAEEALPVSRRSLVIAEKTYGSEHPRIAPHLSTLAMVLQDLGEAEEASALLVRARLIAEKTYGPEHPRVATILSNLAVVWFDLDQIEAAHALLTRAVAIDVKAYGHEHPKVARRLSELAHLMARLPRLDRTWEARMLLEQALAIDEKAYGHEHPKVAERLSQLAGLLWSLSLHVGVRELLERALAIDVKAYGHKHPKVAERLSQLAPFAENVATSCALLKRALAIDVKAYGHKHPKVAERLSQLAPFAANGASQRMLLEQALAIDEKAYGHEHPRLAERLSQLASTLESLDLKAEACTLWERELGLREKIYPPEHFKIRDLLDRLGRADALPVRASDGEHADAPTRTGSVLSNVASVWSWIRPRPK
jgi:tetratricopeptide (TPR) repeat protein